MKASFVYFVTKNLAYICNNRFFGLISAVFPVPDGNIRPHRSGKEKSADGDNSVSGSVQSILCRKQAKPRPMLKLRLFILFLILNELYRRTSFLPCL